MSDQYETWQRVLMATGWTPYSVGIKTEKKKEKVKLTPTKKLFNLNKDQQVKMLLNLGISKPEINKLKKEKDRVDKILFEIQNRNK